MKRSGSTIGRTLRPWSSKPGAAPDDAALAGEAADRALLDRDQHLVLARQPLDQRRVQGLGEPRIRHRRRRAHSAASSSAALRHSCSRVPRLRSAIVVPSRSTRPRPIASGLAALRQRHADPLAARVAHRRRTDRRSPRTSPPCASAPPRPPPP